MTTTPDMPDEIWVSQYFWWRLTKRNSAKTRYIRADLAKDPAPSADRSICATTQNDASEVEEAIEYFAKVYLPCDEGYHEIQTLIQAAHRTAAAEKERDEALECAKLWMNKHEELRKVVSKAVHGPFICGAFGKDQDTELPEGFLVCPAYGADVETTRGYWRDDVVKELRAEIERLRQQQAWQPIETAPRDGHKIIQAWHPHLGVPVNIVWGWDDDEEEYGWFLYGNERIGIVDIKFTRWTPLPQPPATEGDNVGSV